MPQVICMHAKSKNPCIYDLTQGSTLIKEMFNSKGIFQLTKCYTSLKSLSLMLSMKNTIFFFF